MASWELWIYPKERKLLVARNNPLRRDPTRTTVLRSQFMADLRRRFRKLRQVIWQLVVEENAFGLRPPAPNPFKGLGTDRPFTINIRWAFETDARKLKEYQKWFKQQIDEGLLEIEEGVDPERPWTADYVESSYKKAQVRSYIDTKRAAAAAGGEFFAGSQAQFLEQAFTGAVGTKQLEMLATRSFEQLKGMAGRMPQVTSRVLSQGFVEGRGARDIARRLMDEVSGVERREAMRIVRTEIIHSYAEGQLDAFDALGVKEVGVMAEWSTVGDDRVCPLCLPLEGAILTVKEARGMIPRHPQCRCSFIPSLESVSRIARQDAVKERARLRQEAKTRRLIDAEKEMLKPKTTKSQIEASIRKSVKAEGRKRDTTREAFERSKWVGTDKTITKSRKPVGTKR